MPKHIARLSVAVALLAATVLPASAADYFDGGDPPLAFHGRDEVYVDGGRARSERREDLRPATGDRRAPGPVVFDEREPVRGFDRPALRYDRPAFGYDRPVAFVPRYADPNGGEAGYAYGEGHRPAPFYRAATVPVDPAFDEGDADVGCTIEQAQSTTPTGWRKVVTHRTCYRRCRAPLPAIAGGGSYGLGGGWRTRLRSQPAQESSERHQPFGPGAVA